MSLWQRIALRLNAIRRFLFVRKVMKEGAEFLSYKGVLYPAHLFGKKAMAHIEVKALEVCRGNGLDIGAGVWALPGARAIEDHADENAYKLDRVSDSSLDYIFSSHCLEHLERWQEALRLWISKLKPGGVLFLYLPHKDMVMWRPGEVAGIQHVWSPDIETLVPFLEKEGMEVREYAKEKDSYWSFHIIANKK